MRGRLQMSELERRRIGPLERVVRNEISLAVAAEQMEICYRQAVRVLKRYREQGDAGLVHKSYGRPSSRRLDSEFKMTVLALYQEKYPDFGPTLASEQLAERDGKAVNPETLRLWLIAANCWSPRHSKAKHRTWRKRKDGFGEMVQMDGSPHAWFEDRAPGCFLMNLVDDATAAAQSLFSAEETTWAALDLLEMWVRRFGIPLSIYVDRKNVYVTDREPTAEEQLSGQLPVTQFGRACQKLGIRIIEAHSPQAKGRVERKHGVFQDRLIKEMRLEGISDMEGANRFLPAWLDKNNDRFAVSPRSDVDKHQQPPKDLDLRTVFCLQEERSVGHDFTVRYNNRWLQIQAQKYLPKPQTKLVVQEWRDGTLHLFHDGRELNCDELDERPAKAVKKPKAKKIQPETVPAADHPWRKPRTLEINPRDLPELINQLADQYLGAPNFTP